MIPAKFLCACKDMNPLMGGASRVGLNGPSRSVRGVFIYVIDLLTSIIGV